MNTTTPPPAPSPAPTPAPAPVPFKVESAPHIVQARAVLTPAQLAGCLAAVPASPQNLQSLLADFLPLPAGVTLATLKSVTVTITPQGGATIAVQYLSP